MRSYYCRPSDIVTGNATVTAPLGTVSADPNYDLTALYDENPAKPCKFTNTPAVATAILFTFGAAQRLDGFALPTHNLDAGLNVRFQGNAANAWGAPSLDAAVTIQTHDLDGHVKRAWVDLTTVAGYVTGGFQYWRLYIPATNSAAIQLGETLLITQLRTFTRGIRDVIQRPVRRGYIPSLETAYKVKTFYEQEVKQVGVSGTIPGTLQDHLDAQALLDDARGPSRGFFFALDSAAQHAGGLYVRATTDMAAAFAAEQPVEFRDDVISFPWQVEELSCGLPL